MVENVIDYQFEELANAIVTMAVTDYRKALASRNPTTKTSPKIISLEKFFRSDYYRVLTKVDGEYIIEQIRHEVNCK
jgi:hypothetical protein